jgi:hypothetical protein
MFTIFSTRSRRFTLWNAVRSVLSTTPVSGTEAANLIFVAAAEKVLGSGIRKGGHTKTYLPSTQGSWSQGKASRLLRV